MTREEYAKFTAKFRSFGESVEPPSIESMVLLQDATLRAFMTLPGYERAWDDQTSARIARQSVLSKLPRHGR